MSQTAALMAEIDRVRGYLQGEPVLEADLTRPMPPSLTWLCGRLRLAPFERDLLLLCLGMELDPSIPALCAEAQKDEQLPWPTFQLALGCLPQPSWEYLLTDANLRYWQMVEVGKGPTLLRSPLSLPERVMHFLCGLDCPDEALNGFLDAVSPQSALGAERQQLALELGRMLAAPNPNGAAYQLYGGNPSDRMDVAATAAASLGLPLYRLVPERLPSSSGDLTAMIRLWQREVMLSDRMLYVECEGGFQGEGASGHERELALTRLVEEVKGVVILGARERRPVHMRPLVYLEVASPSMGEQYGVWETVLGERAELLRSYLGPLVSQFSLDEAAIRAAVASLGDLEAGADSQHVHDRLWHFCRHHTRPRMGALAHFIEPKATMDDLILPARQKKMLEELCDQVRLRMQVYEDWGFAHKSGRGLGISVLFHGTSGTGKTMASEVLAKRLGLNLYRIDLSSVISKYIGETEKNLAKIFDAAEGGGAVLLFDEADALFGKRSEVKDSHDRHANIEVAFLLQRIERFRGLAILTTNLKENIDQAFLRRIRFVVRFPFPEARERALIWQKTFPKKTPLGELDFQKLARLNVCGGNIRNIAINAAFLAAAQGDQVEMSHVLRAAELEYDKLERVMLELDN